VLAGLVSGFQKHVPLAKDVVNAGVSSFSLGKNGDLNNSSASWVLIDPMLPLLLWLLEGSCVLRAYMAYRSAFCEIAILLPVRVTNGKKRVPLPPKKEEQGDGIASLRSKRRCTFVATLTPTRN
jgi:hypothetical protein